MNREPSKVEQALAVVLAVAYGGFAVWTLVPAHARRLLAMKAFRTIERSSTTLAQKAGQQAILHELAGLHPGYELPAAIGRVRDWAARTYTRLRSAQ
jgi:hypothetical protein